MKTLHEILAAVGAQNKQVLRLVAELECTARELALERAELRHEVRRALVAWDGTVLPKAHDRLLQERMESLRALLRPNG